MIDELWPLIAETLAAGHDVQIKVTPNADPRGGTVYVPLEWLPILTDCNEMSIFIKRNLKPHSARQRGEGVE